MYAFVHLCIKSHSLSLQLTDVDHSLAHAGAAICGETVACLIRVPTDVIKQNAQVRWRKKELLSLMRLFTAGTSELSHA